MGIGGATVKKFSSELNRLAESLRNNADKWRCDEDEPAWLALQYRDDRWDLNYIADRIETNEIKAAWEFAQNLDTIVRDQIPNDVWEHMLNYIEGK